MLQTTFQLYRNSFTGLSRDIWLLALVTFINRSGTMVIPFLTVFMTHQLGFSFQQAGWVMFSFGTGSVIGTYAGGQLTDRLGYYNIQFWTLFISGFIFIVLAYVTDFWGMCGVIFVLSLIADAFRPANFASVAAYSKPENRTRSYSLLRLAVNLGFSAGPALGGFLAAWKGYAWLFWVDGLTCIVAACLFRIILVEKKEITKEIEPEEKKKIRAANSAYRDIPFLAFTFMILLVAIAFMQFFATMPIYFKDHFGLNEAQIGLLISVNGLIIAFLEMPLVFQLEGKYPKLYLIAIGSILVGLSFLSFNIFDSWAGVIWVYVVLITFGEILNMPFANSFSLDQSNPYNRGQYMALYTMTYSIAIVVAPTLGLQIAGSYGFETLWYFLFGLCFLALIGVLVLKKVGKFKSTER